MSARFGTGVYSYTEPSLADRWAVSTTSSPYRVMLACEVSLPPSQVKPAKSSGILPSVSHCTRSSAFGSHTDLPIYSARKDRWSSCQGLKQSHPSISYCTQRPNPRPPNPRELMGTYLLTKRVPLPKYLAVDCTNPASCIDLFWDR